MKEKVLISGGSGLVGQRLSELLLKKGYEVSHLSRSKGNSNDNIKTIIWDVKNQKVDAAAIAPFDHIVNLSGAGIVDKAWTDKRKKVLLESRTKSVNLLKKSIVRNDKKPKTFVSASAVGYYGLITSEHIFKENDSDGNDFLAETCVAWESAVDEIAAIDIPTTKIRTGLVLTDKGGALKEIAKPIKLGFGAALGSGKQYLPWIHIDDLCGMYIHAIENKLDGAFNAAVPATEQLSNAALTKAVAKVLKKPLWMPNVPAFALRIIMGSRALLVLKGSRVSVTKIQKTGYKFKYLKITDALKAIYEK